MCEVGALGRPHWSCAESIDKCRGEEGVELGVELRRNVGEVAEGARHHSPLHRHLLDHDHDHDHERTTAVYRTDVEAVPKPSSSLMDD